MCEVKKDEIEALAPEARKARAGTLLANHPSRATEVVSPDRSLDLPPAAPVAGPKRLFCQPPNRHAL